MPLAPSCFLGVMATQPEPQKRLPSCSPRGRLPGQPLCCSRPNQCRTRGLSVSHGPLISAGADTRLQCLQCAVNLCGAHSSFLHPRSLLSAPPPQAGSPAFLSCPQPGQGARPQSEPLETTPGVQLWKELESEHLEGLPEGLVPPRPPLPGVVQDKRTSQGAELQPHATCQESHSPSRLWMAFLPSADRQHPRAGRLQTTELYCGALPAPSHSPSESPVASTAITRWQ